MIFAYIQSNSICLMKKQVVPSFWYKIIISYIFIVLFVRLRRWFLYTGSFPLLRLKIIRLFIILFILKNIILILHLKIILLPLNRSPRHRGSRIYLHLIFFSVFISLVIRRITPCLLRRIIGSSISISLLSLTLPLSNPSNSLFSS